MRRRLAVAIWFALLFGPPSPAAAARVAEYRMATVVQYTVDPENGRRMQAAGTLEDRLRFA